MLYGNCGAGGKTCVKSKNIYCCDVEGCTLGYNVLQVLTKQRKSNIFFFELDLVLSPFITLVPSNKENPDIWINLFRFQNKPLYNPDEN